MNKRDSAQGDHINVRKKVDRQSERIVGTHSTHDAEDRYEIMIVISGDLQQKSDYLQEHIQMH
jgi:hypothetical protein